MTALEIDDISDAYFEYMRHASNIWILNLTLL
jgi:hypothetical protein